MEFLREFDSGFKFSEFRIIENVFDIDLKVDKIDVVIVVFN